METRDEKGLWLKGVSGNPNGRPKSPWMPYGVRLSMWLEKPATEIKALISDTKKIEYLSCIDVACVKHVTKMMFGKEALKALEVALDRIEGKAVQRNELTGKDGRDIMTGMTDAQINAQLEAKVSMLERGRPPKQIENSVVVESADTEI